MATRAKPSYHSSEKNASSSRQPLRIFSPPPEGTAACIPRHQAGRLGWSLQKRARRTVRGEQAQGNSGHKQIRAEAGTREAEKRGTKKSRNTRKETRPGRKAEENYTRSTSLRDAPPSIYLSNLKSKAINQADRCGFLSAQMTPEQLHPRSLPGAQFRLVHPAVGCKLKNKLLFGF